MQDDAGIEGILKQLLLEPVTVTAVAVSSNDALVPGLFERVLFNQESKIGHTVHKLRKHESGSVAEAAKRAVRQWKSLAAGKGSPAVKEEVASSSSMSQSTTNSRATTLTVSPAQATEQLAQLARGRAAVQRALAKKLATQAESDSAKAACQAIEGNFSPADLAKAAAAAVENALFQYLGTGDGAKLPKEYTDQFRRLHFNFGENKELAVQVLLQAVDMKWLAHASATDVATDSFKKMAQAELIASSEEVMMDWKDKNSDKALEAAGIKVGPGFHRCGNCGSENTSFFQKQTRSADEPMTSFIRCKDCKHHWKD